LGYRGPGFAFPVIVLVIIVVALPIHEAFAAPVTLFYDAGPSYNANGSATFQFAGVEFSLTGGATSAKLLTIQCSFSSATSLLRIHVTASDHKTELAGSPSNEPAGSCGGAGGVSSIDVSSLGVVVPVDFFVVLEDTSGDNQLPFSDSLLNVGRSYVGTTSLDNMAVWSQYNWAIRVIVDPILPSVGPVGPVGGFLEPVNKLAVFAPYLALFGVIGTVAVVFRKRHEN
jgi:hypothetical protein